MRYLLLLLLCSCVSTHNAEVRRAAEQGLENCLSLYGRNPDIKRECVRDSIQFCVSRGLEKSCATDGVADDIYTGKFKY